MNLRKTLGTYKYNTMSLAARNLARIGVNLSMRTEDRRLLEKEIMPYFASDEACRSVLFVGSEWYTQKYNKVFARKQYWTMEINPDNALYGAGQHIIDGIQNIGKHFPDPSLDVILCNGVFGWGLDDPDDIEQAFSGMHNALRPGGVLVLGWDNVPEHVPVPLTSIKSLKSLTPWVFPPLETDRFVVRRGREREYSFHTYNFYKKKA